MPTYIISSHGEPDYQLKTRIPANTQVQFYQKFGTPMDMDAGFALQTALAHPDNPGSAQTLQQHGGVALWNGQQVDHPQGNGPWPLREQGPEINLTGDNKAFYTGIVLADTNQVIYPIGKNQLITLSKALDEIRKDANQRFGYLTNVQVHCLFCL